MFGIKKLLLTALAIVIAGVVVICVAVITGCGSANGALAMKTSANHTEQNADNSIEMSEGTVLYDPVEVIGARAEERVSLIRAQEEKWRLAVWIFGIGAIVVGILALLVRSPFDYRKRV